MILNKLKTLIDTVLYIDAKPETILERLSLRRSCSGCGAIYHLSYKPPENEGTCNECGSELFHREDDKEEIILHRFDVYEKQTYPILERYEKRGKVHRMDGEINIEDIPDEVERILGPP
jgi:adenylate kinase